METNLVQEQDTVKVFREIMGWSGRMISGSKSGYRQMKPHNLVVFNANLIVDGKKVWYGDLDITIDEPQLKQVAQKIGKRVYVLREMDGRFDNETSPRTENAVYSTDGTDCTIGENGYERIRGKIRVAMKHRS